MPSDDLTTYAAEGYAATSGTACPYFASSPGGMAWHVGAWLNATGHTAPKGVRCSRGYKMHANEMLLDVSNVKSIQRLQ